ncbi:hypothetical protein CD351_00630 [Erythrobacter sp. KY5]|uniref:hypothetical protein n=1 Tax=Erythrobacter sp. KY5 TaxID=2011159 RepID=UPI000DBF2383|nr:hypothetical protein [Erythrobacter sp. KY5]AWW72927.1 hypothetical protein CD351_00630 [Erythrobacter sp. KY5]
MSLSFTRREFYDLVWSKPMTHVAKELGVSDVALHKVCRKHAIPNPPLGWWAKKAAGKAVEQIPLHEIETNRPDAIFIRNAPAADWKTQAIEVAEGKAKSALQASIAMPKRGSVIVRNTLAALRRGKAGEHGLICIREAGLIPCSIAKHSIGRVAEFLPRLEVAAEVQGFTLTADDQPSRFSDGSQTVQFEISEGYNREKHELTRKEKAERAAWEKRSERRGWRYAHGDPHPIFADWDYNPTGRLSISFEPVWSYRQPTPRRSFNDGKRQRVEGLVDKIAIGIAVVAAAKAERKRKDDEQARLYEEQRQRREMKARFEYIEERRSDELAIILETQSRLEKLETLLALTNNDPGEGIDSRVQEFGHWLRCQINETRALLTPSGLEERFSELNLFGPEDDRDFRPTSL